ncbi:MAG: cysteine synthase A [Methanomassiliicoccaceae archaeon]|nr:cysteine synthase A [Methanomassiliicoccaceae archaeon]
MRNLSTIYTTAIMRTSTKTTDKMIHENLTDLIGGTPLLRLRNIEKEYGLEAKIIAKIESLNPSGSVKDRVAFAMIDDAEKKGLLKKGSVIIEPTSGNTGIGLAAISASKGYRLILTMPDTMSTERRNLLKAYGAELVLTPGKDGMKGSIDKAEELSKEIKGSVILGQFTNPANPGYHELTTGPEIWKDTGGKIDIFIAGAGTGGTITGIGKYLKSKNKSIRIIAVEPAESDLLSGGKAGPHKIQGIGANFVPDILDMSVIDEVMRIPGDEAIAFGRESAKKEGLLVGISAGAALAASVKLAKLQENKDKVIVFIAPDSGERYLSSEMFQ